jgi:drug/metabolite transporter (DMT)-like permease
MTAAVSPVVPRPAVAAPFVMTTRDWAILVFCALCWGSAYTFNKIMVGEIPSLSIACGRMIIASLFLFSLATLQGVALPREWKTWRPFFFFTLFSNVVPFLFVLRGQRETASGLAAVIGATTPVFVIIIAHFFTTDERLTPRKIAGVLAGIIGVAVVVGPQALSAWSSSLGAKLSLVFAAFLYAVGAIYSRRIVGIPALAMATMQMICGTLVTLPFTLAIDQPWSLPMPPTSALLAMAAAGIIASSLSAIAYFHILKRAGATYAMLVTLLVPVAPIIFGAILFGERLLWREACGGLIIAGALLIIDGRTVAWLMARFANVAVEKT